ATSLCVGRAFGFEQCRFAGSRRPDQQHLAQTRHTQGGVAIENLLVKNAALGGQLRQSLLGQNEVLVRRLANNVGQIVIAANNLNTTSTSLAPEHIVQVFQQFEKGQPFILPSVGNGCQRQ